MPFSKTHADAACNFFEKILKHTADQWYGKPFLLTPWEEDALRAIFGQLDEDGNRVIETVYLEVPKKSGKTEWVAGVLLLVMILAILSKQKGFQVYGAAAATRQALNVYRAACKMVEQSPLLSKHLRLLRGTNRIVARADVDTFYAAIAADGDLGDGVNPACTVADEVHRWKTRKQLENWDVLSKGGITRSQTLTVAITTAGVQDESPLAWKLHEKTRRIQEGSVSDSRFYGRIYGAEKTDDPSLPATWIKANPSLIENGGFLDKEKIRKEYESAVSEGDLTSFKRYFLNVWDQKENRAIDMVDWEASKGKWSAMGLLPLPPEDVVRPLHPDLERYFVDRICWAGVDLSFTTDLSAVTLIFPPTDPDGTWDFLPFFWRPEGNIKKSEVRDGVPYQRWAREGFLELCPGNVIENGLIKERLKWAHRMFDLRMICFDRYNALEMSTELENQYGYKCLLVPQLFNLSEATKKLLTLVKSGKLGHGDHPIMKWNASCLSLKGDDNDNVRPAKPERDKDRTRIDGIAAGVTGMTQAILNQTRKPLCLTEGVL